MLPRKLTPELVRRRMADVKKCKARIERKLIQWPEHPGAKTMKARLAEYEFAEKSYALELERFALAGEGIGYGAPKAEDK